MTETILVAIDIEDTALEDRMLRIASEIASLRQTKVSLVYVAVDAPPEVAAYLPNDFETKTVSVVSEKLRKMAGKLKLTSGKAKVSVRFGAVYREVLSQAKDDSADLIIVGCHKQGIADFLLGSNAARVARHATCSVYVAR